MRIAIRIAVVAILGLLIFSTAALATGVPSSAAAKGSSSSNSGGGGCPSSNAISNFQVSSLVGASVMASNSSWTYYFSSFSNLNSSGGIPGLIEYCVYPAGSLPGSVAASAIGADGSPFGTVSKSAQGYFGFDRANGDPTNVPLDGTLNVIMGTASWGGPAPANQTILLHINDAAECQSLYGGASTTCFVLPGTAPAAPCGGAPVCKSVAIDEASSTSPLTVPSNTLLHIHYTYTISNAATNGFDMEFLATGVSGATTGVKDYFTCQQTADPNGTPSAYGYYLNYSGTGLDLRFTHSGNPSCDRPAFTLGGHSSAVILHPGQSITFTIDMTTHAHGFTGLGTYCINAGVSALWYQSNDGLLHSYHSPMVDVTVV